MAAVADRIEDVRRIAVLRANAIGDYTFCLPALTALRRAYPDAQIVLLGKRWHRELLGDRPGPVDRVIEVPVDGMLSGHPPTAADVAFFEAMRAERFDLALQLHGGGKNSNPYVHALGARVTVGTHSPDAAPLDRSVPFVYFQHEVLRYLEIVALAGAPPVTLDPWLEVTARDLDAVDPLLGEDPAPLVVLNPGATDPRRRWPVERFAAVGRWLRDDGARIAINGDAAERPLADALAQALGGRVLNLAGRLSLHGLVGLVARASLVISNDTGPLHLAHAVGTRSEGLFWAYNMVTSAPPMRRLHRPLPAWRMHCPVCGRHCGHGRCEHEVSFVTEIEVSQVIDAAQALLAELRNEDYAAEAAQ